MCDKSAENETHFISPANDSNWCMIDTLGLIELRQGIICSDNGLSPNRSQSFTWTKDRMLLIGPLEINLSEIWMKKQPILFNKMDFEMSSAKFRPVHLDINVLTFLSAQAHVGLHQTLYNSCGHFYKHGLTLFPAWISNWIHYNIWGEITYPFLNLNGATVEI